MSCDNVNNPQFNRLVERTSISDIDHINKLTQFEDPPSAIDIGGQILPDGVTLRRPKAHRGSPQYQKRLSTFNFSNQDDNDCGTDSDEREDLYAGYEDMYSNVKINDGNVLRLGRADSLVFTDENGEETMVRLTERQQKAFGERVNTFSKRVKNIQSRKNVQDIFPKIPDNAIHQDLLPNDQTLGKQKDEGVDGNRHSIAPTLAFKKHPTLIKYDSSHCTQSNESNLKKSKMSSFQSTPNLVLPDHYRSPNRRIDLIKNQGKNIGQKFRNLFYSKSKNLNIASGSPVDEPIIRRRTASSHNIDEESCNAGVDVSARHHLLPQDADRKRSSKRIDTDTKRNGVDLKSYNKYNSLSRKRNKNKLKRNCLLETIAFSSENANSLQNFGVVFGIENDYLKTFALGKTTIDIEDLNGKRAKLAQKIALLELQADLSDYGVFEVKIPRFTNIRRKTSQNILFGGYLTQLHDMDKKRNKLLRPNEWNADCPSVLHHLVDYLKIHGIGEEGIFRVTGSQNRLNALKDEVAMLYHSYYKFSKPDNQKEILDILLKYTPCDIAGLLKLFLRELAKPLFTDELMEIFLAVPGIIQMDMKIKIMNLLMIILNESHRNSLRIILELLDLVVQHQSENKMSLESVCTVMAPNLIVDHTNSQTNFSQMSPILRMRRRTSFSSQAINEINDEMNNILKRNANSLAVLKLLINIHPILFHVPPDLHHQILNESYAHSDQ